jgi:hypothetical protein
MVQENHADWDRPREVIVIPRECGCHILPPLSFTGCTAAAKLLPKQAAVNWQCDNVKDPVGCFSGLGLLLG